MVRLQEDKRDMLHAVYRVGDMATTIDYYKKHFGMKLLRYRDIPDVRDDLLKTLQSSSIRDMLRARCAAAHLAASDPAAHFVSGSEQNRRALKTKALLAHTLDAGLFLNMVQSFRRERNRLHLQCCHGVLWTHDS